MIITLTLNPALDETWTVDRLVPGATHRVATGASRAGGKGINVARVLHSTGHDVLAVAPVGGASGGGFTAELQASGVPCILVPVATDTRRSVCTVDASTGEATVLNEAGLALRTPDVDAVEDAVLDLLPADVVTISGSLPPDYAPARLGRLVGTLKRLGARVVVDTSGPAMLVAAQAGADLIKPNREELLAATGAADLESGIRVLLDAGAGIVVASDGAAGMILARGTERWRARLEQPVSGNPTGAGDAAVASLTAHLAAKDTASADLGAMATRAVAWSASAVTMPLAGDLAPDHDAWSARVLLTSDSLEPS